jgi:hypothetical protein
MDKPLAVAGLIAFAALLTALATIAYRYERRRDHADDTNPGRLDDILPAATVEHHGADEGWSPAEDVATDHHPLDIAVALVFGDDLVPAYTFASVMDEHPVPLDYPGPDFDAEWVAAGERFAKLGATQALPRIEVAVA